MIEKQKKEVTLTIKQSPVEIFEKQGWINEGEYTPDGLAALAELLSPLSTVWGKTAKGNPGRWGAAFSPLMSKVVPFSTELVVVKDGFVLLTWREFEGTAGWHTPGSYVNPRETWQDTVSRIAQRELCVDATFERTIATFSNSQNPRFHDLTVLARCHLEGEPALNLYNPATGAPSQGQCAWFRERPANILPIHDKYWAPIEAVLCS